MLGLVAIMAAYTGLVGYLAARIGATMPLRLLLVLPGAWVIAEWLRGWLFSGFPWLSLGYGLIDSPLSGFAPVLGVYGVSLAGALLAGGLALLVTGRSYSRLVAASTIAAVLIGGQSLAGVQWTESGDRQFRVALIQGAVPQDRKWLPSQLEPTKKLYLDLTRSHWDRDLVVWPEAAIPAILHEESDFLETVQEEARSTDTALVLGMLERDPLDGRYFNTLITLGDQQAIYRKRHLVPFGEYFPVPEFVREWMRLMSLPYSDITPGPRAQSPLPLAGELAAPSICYEDAFGAELLDFLPEAGLLLNVSNDAWFGDSFAPHQHLQIARMRALETGRFLLRATNTGISALIGPYGSVLARSPQFETHVLTAEIQPRFGSTPYVRMGNVAVVVLAVFMLIAGLFSVARQA
jgi:apolipoprotein N-acyltransferase